MKKIFFTSKTVITRFCFVSLLTMLFFIGWGGVGFAQTNFYNGGTDVTVYPTTILYVDGNVLNNIGAIHNEGDVYLTGDWTNNEPSGCLDPTTGKVILYGSAQTIKGTETTTFNNLDCQGAGTKTLDINTIVGGNTGVLSLNDNPFDLNSQTLEVTNPNASAITFNNGYIISETEPTAPGYGRVQWNLGNTSGNYTYPFGTVTGVPVPFLYNVTASGIPGTVGNISVATYPTDVTASPNNRPLPAGVTDLNDANGNESATTCADRFWVVDINNYTTNPTADMTFTYRDDEWDVIGASTNTIMENDLLAWKWDGIQWENPPLGTLNSSANSVTVTGITNSAAWTLNAGEFVPFICGELEVPNAFSPNNDGRSDLFYLHGWENCVSSFSFVVFDRWGEKVFETEDTAKGWDGTYKGQPMNPAVFVYYIKALTLTGEKLNKKGNISLIR